MCWAAHQMKSPSGKQMTGLIIILSKVTRHHLQVTASMSWEHSFIRQLSLYFSPLTIWISPSKKRVCYCCSCTLSMNSKFEIVIYLLFSVSIKVMQARIAQALRHTGALSTTSVMAFEKHQMCCVFCMLPLFQRTLWGNAHDIFADVCKLWLLFKSFSCRLLSQHTLKILTNDKQLHW